VNILLIWPESNSAVLNDSLSCCEPLPLEYLAGALRPDHDVLIYDGRLDGPLELFGRDFEPDMIGVAIPYTSVLRTARRIAHDARRLWPGATMILGGHHVTLSTEWIDDFPADYVFVGEAFMAIAEVARCVDAGADMTHIHGLVPFEQRRSLRPELRNPDFNIGIRPDRKMLARYRDRYFHSIYRPVALMRFSAGCPYNCDFCSLWKLTDRRYLTKEADGILQELDEIDVDNVYVVDDEAFIQSERMGRIAEAIRSAGVKKRYHMYLRTDTTVRNRRLLEKWAEIGLDSVLVGVESFVDEDLDAYHKNASMKHTLEAMRIFHGHGIKVRANFIVRPDYSKDEFQRLRDNIVHLKVDMPSISVLTPLPGTDLFNATKDKLIADNPDLYDCYHTLLPTRLPLAEFYDELAKLAAGLATLNAPAAGSEHTPMFYFSSDDAFGRMVQALREGETLHHRAY
jgi:methyltransferase